MESMSISPGSDDYSISHGLTLEGTLGLARDFWEKTLWHFFI